MEEHKEKIVALNKREYGPIYPMFKWLEGDEAQRASRKREGILSTLPPGIHFKFCNTKLHSGELSPGCLLCGQGAWSCLFINSLCNASCFYCPTEQPSKSEPMTNGVLFPSPQDYADYIEKFGIGGVGISGGEPFLTFDRTLLFVTRIKKRFGPRVFLWMYTNGIQVTDEQLKKLRDAGLDEIRFDITANAYRLDKVQMAAGILNTVTVEIPAVPEDLDLLKRVTRDLEDSGVKHLNLHQLRATPHNCRKLIERNYTFLHGAQVTVLESEFTALQIMKYAGEKNIRLPINYCSFVFKNQYQTMGHRKRIAPFLCEPYEDITPIGLIRRMAIKAEPPDLEKVVKGFQEKSVKENAWQFHRERNTLFINPCLVPQIDLEKYSLFLSYYIPCLTPAVTYRNAFRELPLNPKRKVTVEKAPVLMEKEMKGEDAKNVVEFLMASAGGDQISLNADRTGCRRGSAGWGGGPSRLEEIHELECIRPGLQEYY